MAIPGFQSMMLPLLRALADGTPHSNQEILDVLAKDVGLSDEERVKLLPSGRTPVFSNRVAWGKVHLKAAGLIESQQRGSYSITQRGLDVLAESPRRVDIRLLRRYPEYQDFRSPKKKPVAAVSPSTEPPAGQGATPQEQLEESFATIRRTVASDLLRRLREAPPAFFERVVIDLLKAMGYAATFHDAAKVTGRGGDGGIDGIIKQDRLGLDVIYVQAKRWEGNVGRPEIQRFAGALQGQQAKKGVLITTSGFTKDAEDYANRIDSKIVLVGGNDLAELMLDFGIGVSAEATYVVKRVDSDYFDEGAV
jgi:restriction system protein